MWFSFWSPATHYSMLLTFCSLLIALPMPLLAQDDGWALIDRDERSLRFSDAIEDNSFFIEEAYNQEPGIIQHISNGVFFSSPQKSFVYSLTEEYPIGSQTHQLGFSIPYLWLDGNSVAGIGDILINYRYQLADGTAWAAMSPRLSLILPAGNADKGLGSGVVGVQLNLPVSKRLSNHFIVHANVGTTILPSVKSTTAAGNSVKRTLASFNLGMSGIVLASEKFNLLLEVVQNFMSNIDEVGEVQRSSETIFSPGMRLAIDIGTLQIVPGIAAPVVFSNGEVTAGMFFYLSFEHPF